MEYGLMGLSVLAAIVGLGMAYRSYAKAGKDYVEPIAAAAPPLYTVLYNKWFVDEATTTFSPDAARLATSAWA
jgi:NADH:ubiquinone oxidoreductase subunit 5 (subunit L)/multisubunit Na+/H+ antiporter MnhA subunit